MGTPNATDLLIAAPPAPAPGRVRRRACPPREGRWLAAVLYVGPAAALSHVDAGALWNLIAARGARIHVTTRSTAGRSAGPTLRVHRVATLRDDEVTTHDGIRVTTVARTLLDLAPTVRGKRMEALIAEADRLERFDLRDVRRVLAAHPRQHGAPTLAALLADLRGRGPADTRSPAEVAFLQLCDDHGLPRPRANVKVGPYLVDFVWPGTSLIVEVDGLRLHRTPTAFAADRERDQALTLAGDTVVRLTPRQLAIQRAHTADLLRRLLERCVASRVP